MAYAAFVFCGTNSSLSENRQYRSISSADLLADVEGAPVTSASCGAAGTQAGSAAVFKMRTAAVLSPLALELSDETHNLPPFTRSPS